MDPLPIFEDFINSKGGSKVNHDVKIVGMVNIHMFGKSLIQKGVTMRGDLETIRIGKLTIIGENSIIQPPSIANYGLEVTQKIGTHLPVVIGDHVFIGKDSKISAAEIGSFVYIGNNCVIGERCILRDCCRVEDNSVVPSDTVIPSFTSFSGIPARMTSQELPECTELMMKDLTTNVWVQYSPKII
ncbi:hypothetical protein C9374_003079 [Naegleria lovaniensis]|uniref:Dynactin subunit 5 n=1 Tax=Naegleria lovaniensis TaxID=51637 RepID=A0AA88KJS1_NAELO|nr:uncharacterized protein C9374_003079 [Naegleria lovaniensis]KAG2385930.1 hypothetical protein C9374_003079 [Naegleria lovaniensis]